MRRQLMKKMRKGSLTPSERAELRELDREVNRANRQAAGIGGAGLAAALAIASKAGAGDALGEFLDKRQEKKKKKKKAEFQAESQKIGEKVSDQVREDAKKELMDSLPGDKSDVRISIDDISIPKIQDIEEEEENFEDKELNDTLKQYELQKDMEQGTNVPFGGIMLDEAVVVGDANKDTPMPLGPPRDEFDRLQAVREAQQAPYVSSMSQSTAEKMLNQKLRSEGYTHGRSDSRAPEFTLFQDKESGEYRFRIKEDAKGGYTPFLRSMRDRIRRRIR